MSSEFEPLLNPALKISWEPAIYEGGNRYICGPMGRHAPKPADWKPMTTLPAGMKLTISIFHDSEKLYLDEKKDPKLYEQTLDLVTRLGEPDQIKMEESRPPWKKTEILNPKPEFKEIVEDWQAKNTAIMTEFHELIVKLEELGCDIDDGPGSPRVHVIPQEYFVTRDYLDFGLCYISFCMNFNMKIYQFLKEQGVLDRVFPQWYRDL